MYFKHILKFACLFVFIALSYHQAIGQSKTVTGIVVSDSANAPLEGVTIKVKGANQSTYTNKLGRFTLEVRDEKTFLV